jgi:hypothetical protein
LNESGSKLNSGAIGLELERTLLRYRVGLLTEAQAGRELAILQAMLKAVEQTDLERKLDALQALLGARR